MTTGTILQQVGAGETGGVKWTEVIDAVTKVISTFGLVVAAAWAYLKFVRGRSLRASCLPSVGATAVEVDGCDAISVAVNLANNGTVRLSFPASCRQTVTIAAADNLLWDNAAAFGEVLWSHGHQVRAEVLEYDGIRDATVDLEPGESICRSLLLPLPAGDWRAFRVHIRVEAEPMVWLRRRQLAWWSDAVVLAKGP